MIKMESLTKNFGEIKAVNNLHLEIHQGINGLVGENGAGKSTLLRLIAGVLTPSEGSVYIDEYSAQTKQAKEKVFFLPDDPYAPGRYNIHQVIDFYSNFYDIDHQKLKDILSKLELPNNKRIIDFSKGMRRQLFLAIAISIKADYLLLDEAFDGIDPLTLDLIKQELIKLSVDERKTIIIASHNIDSLSKLADRFILLFKGKLSEEKEIFDMGNELVKYQILTDKEIQEEYLESIGIRTVSVKKVGSIYNIVLLNQEGLEEKLIQCFKPTLIENIPLEQTEIVTMEMLLARKKEK